MEQDGTVQTLWARSEVGGPARAGASASVEGGKRSEAMLMVEAGRDHASHVKGTGKSGCEDRGRPDG